MSDRAAGASDGRQVLVVGDGVGGLSAAAFLRRQGLDPTVVAGPPPRSTDREAVERCVILWDTPVALLADLGVTAELASSSVEIGTWVVSTADGTVLERLEAPDREAHPFLAVDRRRLRRALRDRLPSRSVRLTKTPRALRTDDGPPVVEFEDGVRERFDLVVGADGAGSWVGTNGFDADRPTADGMTTWAFRADGAGVPGTVAEAWGTDAMVAVIPVTSGACGRLVTTAGDAAAAADALAGAFGRADHPVTGGFDLPGPDALVGGPDYVRRADPWAADRVALVGDAARTLPPCSLGPSLAVEDAYVLADELSDRTGTAAALGRYECRRRGRLHRLDDRAGPDGAARHPLSAAGLPDLLELRLALLRSTFARRTGASELSPAERI
jgi:2-polyprenyl-6-methoxyphenol hydroxylase-like FAD-dependent oxidoreductase